MLYLSLGGLVRTDDNDDDGIDDVHVWVDPLAAG